MNLVDATVTKILQAPKLVEQPDGVRLWEVKYLEDIYGTVQERTERFTYKPDHLVVGYKYQT